MSMEQVTDRLRAAGLRVTAPRVSVLGVLDASECPPTFGTPTTMLPG